MDKINWSTKCYLCGSEDNDLEEHTEYINSETLKVSLEKVSDDDIKHTYRRCINGCK